MPEKFESNENFTKGGRENADLARNFSPNDRNITGIPVYGEAGAKSDYIDKLGFPSSSSLLPTDGNSSGGGNEYTMRGMSDTGGGGSYNQGSGGSYNQSEGGSYTQGGDATSMPGRDNSPYSGTYNQAPDDPNSSAYSGGLEATRGGGTKTPQNLWDDITDFFGLTPND